MKFKIINAGFECDPNKYFDMSYYYFGVTIQSYKYSNLFKRNIKNKKFTIELVYDKNKQRCIQDSLIFINHTEEYIMNYIIEHIKSTYGVSKKQLSDKNDLTEANNKFKKLIGKNFEVDI